jgi:TetR/AcrR family transcriptional regulator
MDRKDTAHAQGRASRPATGTTRGRRRPGRPPSGQVANVRERLLVAARDLVIEVGFDRASTKEIAARAGVNPAMISYYFKSKAGLGEAMMRAAVAPLMQRLETFAAARPDHMRVTDFMRTYMRTIAEHPALPQLIVREVLPANGRFRAVFFEELAGKAGVLLPAALRRARDSGELRRDAEDTLAAITLVSLAVFPFVAAPVIESVLHVRVADHGFQERLIAHSVRVLERGLIEGARA